MPAPVLCFVRIPCSTEAVDQMEAAHPDAVEAIIAVASKYMTRHRRAADDNEVIEVHEYRSQADFEAFMTEAAPALARWSELLGVPPEATVYQITDEDDSWIEAAALR